MTDYEKVVKGLSVCKDSYSVTDCENCPYQSSDYYGGGCTHKLAEDALFFVGKVNPNLRKKPINGRDTK